MRLAQFGICGHVDPMNVKYEARELRYLSFKRDNPQITFAQYEMELQYRKLNSGRVSNPSGALAVALGEPLLFWSAGRARAMKLFKAMSLVPSHKVIDYGCGGLRIGAHFIRHLNRGGFFGLDVISGFYESGKKLIGPQLLEEKAPLLCVIDEVALREGSAFSADYVFSNTVCVHVRPEEVQTYFGNLACLTKVPGSRLIFNATLSKKPLRYGYDEWSWPLEFYRESLHDLELVRAAMGRPREVMGNEIKPVEFEFRR